jgi:isoaspartyl peptidase/L-asparaginase-like protein (Ntn-hydrolase superfamily)
MGHGVVAGDAAREAISGITRIFGPETAGIILLDRDGSPGISFNTRGMAVGYGGEGIDAGARIVMEGELEEFSAGLFYKTGAG